MFPEFGQKSPRLLAGLWFVGVNLSWGMVWFGIDQATRFFENAPAAPSSRVLAFRFVLTERRINTVGDRAMRSTAVLQNLRPEMKQ